MLSRKLLYQSVRFSSSAVKLDLSGIFPPIPTPFDQDHIIAKDKLRENFQKWNEKGFRGYVIFGSNGEFPFLTESEKLDLIRFAKDLVPKNHLLIAGAGREGTSATVDMCGKLADAGVDAVLVHTPCFYKGRMTMAALEAHYKHVAANIGVPLILYNVPPNTMIDMTADSIIRLAAEPNIIGLKESGGDITKLTLVVHETSSSGFQVLAGSAGFLMPALHIGCVGGVVAAANVLGSEVVKLCELCKQEKWSDALKLQGTLVAPNAAITRGYGVAALKHMMDLLGYYGGPVRSPLLPLDDNEARSVEAAFKKSGFL